LIDRIQRDPSQQDQHREWISKSKFGEMYSEMTRRRRP
jgi:hypothetical protein